MVDAQTVQSPHHEPAGFDLHPPEAFSTLHDEVVAMQAPVRQRQREAQARRLVHKSRLAQLALKRIYAPAPASIPDRALLGRRNAPAWSAPASTHCVGKKCGKKCWKKVLRTVIVSEKCYGLSSRPELLIPEGDEKWSGGTLHFVQATAILKMLWQKKRRKPESLRQTLSLFLA
jgi:hypothetical protein